MMMMMMMINRVMSTVLFFSANFSFFKFIKNRSCTYYFRQFDTTYIFSTRHTISICSTVSRSFTCAKITTTSQYSICGACVSIPKTHQNLGIQEVRLLHCNNLKMVSLVAPYDDLLCSSVTFTSHDETWFGYG